ncbi:c-type cytochrome [Sphingobacterium rhinopitheci]|uniref:c-type cytochrome n=1 Tax=Sphingobacterium rhinopitheci TaxID=2781960 RepID=UPI001F51EDEE|nr:c-type cytochrome [Sphingobacterium rhinopitheci]MCI0921951.1 c-type cytochrome [Sphingobacterium rhinopitheci]
MLKLNKVIIIGTIASLVVAISAFTQPEIPPAKEKPTNLKVLPKNISDEELTKVMRGFNAALGVKCGHCHAAKPNGEKGMDFASDTNPNKDVARAMLKMTNKINKKYFNEKHEGIIQNITCETCHNGKAIPKTVALK